MTGAILISDVVEARHAMGLEQAAPGVERIVLGPDGANGDLTRVEAALFSGDLYPDRAQQAMLTVAQATNLRWLHSFSAGIDHPAFLALQERGVRLTHSAGAAAVPIAQTVGMFILALSRDFRAWEDARRVKQWERHDVQELPGRVLGVLGLGQIGTEVARIGDALRMRVIGMRRTPKGDEPYDTWPIGRLPELLDLVDYLVLSLPLNAESRHILDTDALGRMKPEAYVINVGRGELIDEPALVRALQEGRLAGAALDVFEEEPLPQDSPLWEMDNVIVTPHNSGSTPANSERATTIFLDNLGRYIRGEALRNEVPAPAPQ